VIEKIKFESIKMESVKSPFVVNSFYWCDPDGKSSYVATQEAIPVDSRTPSIKDLTFRNIVCEGAEHSGVCIYGLPERKIESVILNDASISFSKDAAPGVSAMMAHCGPSCRLGIFVRNVHRLAIKNTRIVGALKELDLDMVDEIVME
jgi:polygalacturonase